MKYAVMFFLCLFSFGTIADVQIDQAGEDTHAPFDTNDTDNEIYVGSAPTNGNIQYEGSQTAYVKTIVGVETRNLPDELANIAFRDTLVLNPDNTPGEQCTITDVNGDARQTNSWEVTFTRVKDLSRERGWDRDLSLAFFRITVWCSDR